VPTDEKVLKPLKTNAGVKLQSAASDFKTVPDMAQWHNRWAAGTNRMAQSGMVKK
jgi:hypothetical protein